MLAELNRAAAAVGGAQQRMKSVVGEAWSADRMIRALVGPRGQLVELEIDPRVLRMPDSKALAAAIVTTVRLAVEQASVRSLAILEENLPAGLGAEGLSAMGVAGMLGSHDAQLLEDGEQRDG